MRQAISNARPRLLRGFLVSVGERSLTPTVKLIGFQYNPQQMSRSLEIYSPPGANEEFAVDNGVARTVQPFAPSESIALTLDMDAMDDEMLDAPLPFAAQHGLADVVIGVADRIAALEQLLWPTQKIKSVGSLVPVKSFGKAQSLAGLHVTIERAMVPLLFLIWGPGRMIPVRITSFKVEEQSFSAALYPTQARVNISLRLLTHKDIADYEPSPYAYTAAALRDAYDAQRKALSALDTRHLVTDLLGSTFAAMFRQSDAAS